MTTRVEDLNASEDSRLQSFNPIDHYFFPRIFHQRFSDQRRGGKKSKNFLSVFRLISFEFSPHQMFV
jgi:hypothetical protein